jgi:hypothetical protein
METKARGCAICRRPIEMDRIQTIPETRLCLEHAEKIKEFGGEFIVSKSLERTSKSGSLKRNFGGVNVKQTRNHQAIERLKDAYEEEKWREKE